MTKSAFLSLFILFIFLNLPASFALPPSETGLAQSLKNYPDIVASSSAGNITKAMLIQELSRSLAKSSRTRPPEDLDTLAKQQILAMSEELLLRHYLKNDPLAPSPELVRKTLLANPDEALQKLPPEEQETLLKSISADPARQFQVSAWLWIQRDIMPGIEVTQGEVEDFYRKHQNQFLLPPETSWQCLIARNSGERDRIAARLAQLESFAEIAGSFPPPDQKQLDQYWQLPGTAETLARLKSPGEWTQIAGDDGSTLFIMLRKRGIPSYLPLSRVRGEIKKQLEMAKVRQSTSAFFTELRKTYQFQIHAGSAGSTTQP